MISFGCVCVCIHIRGREGVRESVDFSNKAPFMCLESPCQGMLSEDGLSYASQKCLLCLSVCVCVCVQTTA